MIAEQMKRIEQLTADIEAKTKKDPELMTAQKTAMEGLQKQDQALAAAKESAARAAATIPAQQSKIDAGKQKLSELEKSAASVSEVQKAKQAEPPVAFHFDDRGSSLLVARQQGSITVIDVTAGRVASELKSTAPLTQALMIENRILSAAPQVPLTAWTGQAQWKLERVIGSETDPKSLLSDRVTALAFNPNSSLLAVGSGPASRFGDVKLFRMSDGGLEKDFGEIHSDTVLDVAFSPDGEQLATCGADKLIRVFDLATGKQRLSLEGHTHHVLSIAWQDSGRVLASAGADATVKFWDMITGEQQRTVTGFNKEITSITFVGQSSQLLAAAADNSLRLVESTNGKTERSFSGANSPLFALCVNVDGKQVLAGGQDGRLAIWAIDNAKLEKQLD
jgi:WD40 repeat protein